jgi:alanyl-tRNA synthetase
MKGKVIPGETVFKLYDTYGFPADLTNDIARERGLTLDEEGFEKAMDAQRAQARAASSFAVDYGEAITIEGETEFTGYEQLEDSGKVVALFAEGKAVEQLNEGQQGLLVLDRTPFYAESGGQAGDHGQLVASGGAAFTVMDTQKQGKGVFAHIGQVNQGVLKVGDSLAARVDSESRQNTALNHSATHLLHAALRQLLGEHVTQKGSLVNAERLRFDFSHFEPVTAEQLREIENLVNHHIRLNHEVVTRLMDQEKAKASGAMALFGEKYDDEVRVLSMGDFSIELCGGTHVKRTGDIGVFKIVSESGIAAGVRRIEAVTGQHALDYIEETETRLQQLASMVKGSRDSVQDKVSQVIAKSRELEKELEQLKAKLASSQGSDLAAQAVEIGGIQVLAARLDGVDPKSLRDTVDQLKNKLGTAAIVLATVKADKVSLVAGVTKDATDRLKAGELVNQVAQQVGGKGGGRPDMAQAGGSQPEQLDDALASVNNWISEQLAGK